MDNSKGPNLELLIGKEDLEPLFSRGFEKDSINPVGYDFRLGNRIGQVTLGKTVELEPEQEVDIYPGETIIVCTEEVLNLPIDVFALGSPKMGLLLKGLWAHGGKTDFGYTHDLQLGFQNVGSNKITLKRGQEIFHLTFFKVHNKKTENYTSASPAWPVLEPSILDTQVSIISKDKLDKVKQREGIKVYDICKQIIYLNNKIDFAYYIPFLAIITIVTSFYLQTINILSSITSLQINSIAAFFTVLAGIDKLGRYLWGRFTKKEEK